MLHVSFSERPSIWSLAWAPHPDGHMLATGLSNGRIMFWDVRMPLAPVALGTPSAWGARVHHMFEVCVYHICVAVHLHTYLANMHVWYDVV